MIRPSPEATWWRSLLRALLPVLGLLVLATACRRSQPSVRSYLEGRVVVDSSVTSSNDYSDFRVLVVNPNGRQLDTLGHARTDPSGRFRMTIVAPKQGLYPLSLWGREGRRQLATTNYVVAAGDSATLDAELPFTQERPLRPQSPENQALLGYRNAMVMHRRMLTRRLQAEAYRPNALVQSVRLTSSTLWSLHNQYTDTYVGQFAAVESVSLLEGWNDSLVVARARQIAPSSPYFSSAVRIARRAEARRHGHQAALALLDSFQVRASRPSQRAVVKAVRVQAFLDSMQLDAAVAAAQQLRDDHPDTQWAEWARRVRHEAQTLMPGMPAPNLTVQTLQGDTLSLHNLRGHPVVLEYYRPGTDLYNLLRPLRNALYRATRPDSVAFVSISIEPDSLVNRAFLHNRSLPGHTAIAPRGPEDPLVTPYNVVRVPTWFLIDSEGNMVDQYRRAAFPTLRQHLIQLLMDHSSSASPARPSAMTHP
ncbi:MAG: hypothetical protein ABEL51_11315 [Salinibacter sp.]